jgi:NhaP-type Na+/H+ or K+/H+ antiporter
MIILIILEVELYDMGAFEIFAIVASAIALVFVSWAVFRMTRFPPGVLFIFLGAVLAIAGSTIPPILSDTVKFLVPIILGAVLFGCGLKMNLRGIAKHRSVLILSLFTIVGTMGITGLVSYFLLGMGLFGAILVGAICASVCSFFVFHIVDAINLEDRVADTLTLESSLTEAIAIMIAFAVFQSSSGISALQSFSFGLVFGLLFGIVWVRLMRFATDFPHRDALTLSLVLAVAAFCEWIFPNSGMTSALFFGLAIGNSELLKSKARFEGLLRFQEDALMAGGTFIYFYFGLLASKLDLFLALGGVFLWVAVLLVRTVGVFAALPERGFSISVAGLSPKGLASVLIALLAATGSFAAASGLFSISIPVVLFSGIFAGVSPTMIDGRKPPKVDEVVRARDQENQQKNKDNQKPIEHAYDVEELKRTINGEK